MPDKQKTITLPLSRQQVAEMRVFRDDGQVVFDVLITPEISGQPLPTMAIRRTLAQAAADAGIGQSTLGAALLSIIQGAIDSEFANV